MAAAFRRDPRYLVLLMGASMGLAIATGCDKKDSPDTSGEPHRPAPIPTTPEHRKPMSGAEVKRFENMTAQQIAGHKEALAAKCREAIEAVSPSPVEGEVDPEALKKAAAASSSAEVTVMIVFDEEGKEATREVVDVAEAPTGVAKCVGEHLPPITIPAPKRKVRVKIPLSFR